jgi:hypothetical protein
MVWLGAILVSLLLQNPAVQPGPPAGHPDAAAPPGTTQQSQPPAGQSVKPVPPQPAQQAPKADQDSQQPSTFSIESVVSIDRIRKQLERSPTLSFVVADPDAPRFRIEVRGNFTMPERVISPATPFPQVFGGTDYYDMQRVITPPQYWGSSPMTNSDVLGMAALSGAYALVGALVKSAIVAHHSAAEARVHEEVQQELADLAEHNARLARGQAEGKDAGAAQKPDDKDKNKKKKPEKKKDEKK